MPDAQRERTGLALRDPIPWRDLVQVAETAEQTGYEAVFVPEIAAREAFATMAGLAGATEGLRLGTGVAAVPWRTTAIAAMAAATVQDLSGGRLILGVGSGPPGPGALARTREYVSALRDAFAGRPFPSGAGQSQLMLSLHEPPPVWLAALGDGMIRLAGEIADGVLLNWCTPERVVRARELLAEGAGQAGRDLASVTVGVYIRACVGQEAAVSMQALAEATQMYAGMPHYRHQLDLMGLGELAAASGGDPARVPSEIVRALCLIGEPDEARERLEEYRLAGADLPIVYPVPVLEPVSSIMGTVLALAPSPELEP